MFITIEELRSVLYEYQMDAIAENDDSILEDAILSAETEVGSYLLAANARRESATLNKQQYANWKLYDVNAIFALTGTDRNAFLVRLTKRVAAWNIVELSAPDVLYDRVKERYDASVKLLEKIAGMPRQQKYFEVGSCSNLGDAQARRLKIRVNGKDGNKFFAHTLNNTVVAPPRMLIAFLENNLQADGSVRIPEVLRPYMGGMTEIR